MSPDERAYQAVKDLQNYKTERLGVVPSVEEMQARFPGMEPLNLIEMFKVIAWKHPAKGWTH